MIKEIKFGDEARKKLIAGANIVANAAEVTLGAKGRNVILHKENAGGNPFSPMNHQITKDGVTVVAEIELDDEFENIGAQCVKEASVRTADDAGDGTTTSAVLAKAILNHGVKLMSSGHNPVIMKRGMDLAVAKVVDYIKANSTAVDGDVSKIRSVATISANNDPKIGDLIAEGMEKIEMKGEISVEESRSVETSVSVLDGIQIDSGYMTHHFVTDRKSKTTVLENVYIIVTDKSITQFHNELQCIAEHLPDKSSLMIVAEKVDGEALAILLKNHIAGSQKSVILKKPITADIYGDICAATGAAFLSDKTGEFIEDFEFSMFGYAEKAVIHKDRTILINAAGNQERVNDAIESIKADLSDANEIVRKTLSKRISNLQGKVAVLKLGATSEVELKEKADRVDDALRATKAAIEEGVIVGGGIAYLRASRELRTLRGSNDDEDAGIKIIREAIQEPIKSIIRNAGEDPGEIIGKINSSKRGHGWNALTGTFEDLGKAGVIDPAKVVRVAIENAASVAGMLLTTECAIVNKV